MVRRSESPSEWHCDCCGEKVAAEDVNLEWSKGKSFNEPAHDIKIVHRKTECSFRSVTPGDTYAYLSDFVGYEGLFSLVKILESNASNILGRIMSLRLRT